MPKTTSTLQQLLTVADDQPGHAVLYPLPPAEGDATAWELDGEHDPKEAATAIARAAGWTVVDQWKRDDDAGRWEIEIRIQNTVETA